MDLAEPFKPEVLRPVITLVVPGTIAVGPYILVLAEYVPVVITFWTEHPTAFAILLIQAVLTAGFVIDDIGSFIEKLVWDRRLDDRTDDRKHTREWYEYLKLQLNDELVGQRHLRVKVTQLKFELAMAVALPIFWSGLLWLQAMRPIWPWGGFLLLSGFLLGGAVLFLWTSYETAKLLARLREKILEAFQGDGPKGIRREKQGA